MRKSCGQLVESAGKLLGKTLVVSTSKSSAVVHGDKGGALYTNNQQLFPGLFHGQNSFFSSVTQTLLLNFHRTNKYKLQSIYKYLVLIGA